MVIIMFPVGGLVAGAAPEIVTVLLGAAFLPAAAPAAWLIFFVISLGLINVVSSILIAADYLRWPFILTAPLLPIALISYLVVIPEQGAVGAACVAALTTSGGAVAMVITLYRLQGVYPPPATLLRSVILCGLVYSIVIYWSVSGWMVFIKLMGAGVLIIIAYLGSGEFTANERSAIWSALLSRKL